MNTLEYPDLDEVQSTSWWRDMEECAQDPVYHPEGDVATHTLMVWEALHSDPEFLDLAETERAVLAWAALLHDAGKPATTRIEGGCIRTPRHSIVGAILARRVLWELAIPFSDRERVCGLVRMHMRPGYWARKPDPDRELITLSWATELRSLTILARADARGRGGDVPQERLALLEMPEDDAKRLGVWDAPWPFANAVSRFEYFQRPDRSPYYAAHYDAWGEVLVMSGLPGAGKDTWLEEYRLALPVVSFDALRRELGLAPGETTGALIQSAQERAREYLRREEPFAWNTTGLSLALRRKSVHRIAKYGARAHIVYVEADPEVLTARNESRAYPVPPGAVERMLRKWDVPTPVESHHVTYAPGFQVSGR